MTRASDPVPTVAVTVAPMRPAAVFPATSLMVSLAELDALVDSRPVAACLADRYHAAVGAGEVTAYVAGEPVAVAGCLA